MKLKMSKREGSKKSDLSKIRREGNVPAVVYSSGKIGEKITIDGSDIKAALRSIVPGRLSTTRFSLTDGKEERSVIVKEIQYYPTTYEIRHLDLLAVASGQTVRVKVPIEPVGVADCQGIKLGGFLRSVLRYVEVECTDDRVPEFLTLDIRDLAIGQSKRLSDLTFPEGVRPVADMRQVAILIAKR